MNYKKAIVLNCGDCNCNPSNSVCILTNTKIEDTFKIPDNCPLEDILMLSPEEESNRVKNLNSSIFDFMCSWNTVLSMVKDSFHGMRTKDAKEVIDYLEKSVDEIKKYFKM